MEVGASCAGSGVLAAMRGSGASGGSPRTSRVVKVSPPRGTAMGPAMTRKGGVLDLSSQRKERMRSEQPKVKRW